MPPDAQRDPWRLEDFAASLTASSNNTVAAYSADVRDFVGWAARGSVISPDAVQRTLLRRYVSYLTTRRFAKRSIARKVAALRRYFKWLQRSGVISIDPSASLRSPAGEGRLPRVLDENEIDHLLDPPDAVADGSEPEWRSLRDDAVLEILYGSGVRVSELCGLDVDNVDVVGRTIVVWGKGGKQRRVPLSDPARDALAAWLTIRLESASRLGDGIVECGAFWKRTRKAAYAARCSTHCRPSLLHADSPPCTPSQLRDTFAGRRGRLAGGAGTTRTRGRRHDAAVHTRQQRTAARCVRGGAPARMRHYDITHWWSKWFESRDPTARDRIIVHYSPLVKFVAGRVGAGLPSSVDPGDLVSAGVFGLIDAVERFDPERGVKFETFAVPRIRGAVFDGLRSLDWVPRSVRSRAREVEGAFTELEGRHGRAPTDEEIAQHLKISQPEFQKWLVAIASTTVGPLDRALVAGAEPRSLSGETPDSPASIVEDSDVRRLVRAEVRRLPEREKLVMSLYYDEGLTLSEIGSVLGVTESRVSQIHTKSVLHLRARLAAAGIT